MRYCWKYKKEHHDWFVMLLFDYKKVTNNLSIKSNG